MNMYVRFIGMLTIPLLLSASAVFAQDQEPAPATETVVKETAADKADAPASQEVDITEDNYRQFMELKDAREQRNIIPENVFKPDSGLQKLDKLPEESQKHLRNQLREIISQGDQWQPGDEEIDYPYVPSKAALANQQLQNQEAEAWGELVDNYNKREAQIYENAARTRAAMATEDGFDAGAGGGSGDKTASSGEGSGERGEIAQDPQRQRSGADEPAGGYSPDSSNPQGSAGVSQNALEFLKGTSNQDAKTGEADGNSSADENGQGDQQAQGDAAQAGQQDGEEQARTASAAAESPAQNPAAEPESESTKGTSQNALEYLKGEAGQDPSSETTAPAGTLSIEDLLKAQGVLDAGGTTASGAIDDRDPDKNPPDKDGGNG